MLNHNRFILWVAIALVAISLSAGVSSAQTIVYGPGKTKKVVPNVPTLLPVPYETGYTFLGSPTYPGGGFNADARPNYAFYYGVDFPGPTFFFPDRYGHRPYISPVLYRR